MTSALPQVITPALTPAQQTQVVNLIRRAARAEILPRFRNLSSGSVSEKSNFNDLVTEADIEAEAMITRGLLRLFPSALVVGEEAISKTPELRDKIDHAELTFIIDPVDGTANFVHGLTTFGVILSVTRFGTPVFGLHYDPILDDYLIADTGDKPTRRVTSSGSTRAVRTAESRDISGLNGYIHMHLMEKDIQAQLAPMIPDFGIISVLRCSCHEYRTLAQGGVHFALSAKLNPWDHAAGTLLVERAGGYVRMLDGTRYSTKTRDGYLLAACNEETWHRVKDHLDFLTSESTAA